MLESDGKLEEVVRSRAHFAGRLFIAGNTIPEFFELHTKRNWVIEGASILWSARGWIAILSNEVYTEPVIRFDEALRKFFKREAVQRGHGLK